MPGDLLDTILRAARKRADALQPAMDELMAAASTASPVRSLEAALTSRGLQVVAEVKRRSPSVGPIDLDLDPVRQAKAYEAGGAAAISVLTEPDHFGGSLADLSAVRSSVELPVLRKDFLLAEPQVWEARAAGADAVLLIVAALTDDELAEMLAVVERAGMEALVEVHTEEEAGRALLVGARVVGVNNRDLHSFVTDLAVAERLSPCVEGAACTVAESGIHDPDHAAMMLRAGYDAVLVGEALVRATNPAGLLEAMRGVSA